MSPMLRGTCMTSEADECVDRVVEKRETQTCWIQSGPPGSPCFSLETLNPTRGGAGLLSWPFQATVDCVGVRGRRPCRLSFQATTCRPCSGSVRANYLKKHHQGRDRPSRLYMLIVMFSRISVACNGVSSTRTTLKLPELVVHASPSEDTRPPHVSHPEAFVHNLVPMAGATKGLQGLFCDHPFVRTSFAGPPFLPSSPQDSLRLRFMDPRVLAGDNILIPSALTCQHLKP